MTNYQPSEFDVIWAKNVLSYIKHGGQLIYPNTNLQYRIFQDTKTMVLENPEVLDDPGSRETHERTIIVFGKIEWTVIVANDC